MTSVSGTSNSNLSQISSYGAPFCSAVEVTVSRTKWEEKLLISLPVFQTHPAFSQGQHETHPHTQGHQRCDVRSVSVCDPASNNPMLTEHARVRISIRHKRAAMAQSVSLRKRSCSFDAVFIQVPLTHYLNQHEVECLESRCAFNIEWKTNWREGKLQQQDVAATENKWMQVSK